MVYPLIIKEVTMDQALVDETVTLTQELIRIRSENPGGTEEGMADRVEDYFKKMGLDVERDHVVEGRQNVIAELNTNLDAPTLVFLNHMDTVPAGDGWTHDPFSAEISEGKLWGRGSCDMKGGLAAGLIAIKHLKMKLDQGARLRRSVRTCLVVDEECSWMQGVSKAVELGRIGKEDIVIACEPTSLELKTAQKGALWYEIVFSGKSAHAATPQMGANAIQAAAKTLIRLEEAAASMNNTDELLGKTTIVTSVIDGGSKTNIVPDTCRIEVDVRFVPPLSVAGVREMLEKIASEACQTVPGTSAQIHSLSVDRPPILSSLQADNAEIICKAITDTTGVSPVPAGVSYYSDAGLAAARTGNRQCYLLGPGNIEQAHIPNEFIDIEELKKSAIVIGSLTEQFALS
jgi:succinyl-diaminopimelate desuccinylase